MFLTCLIICESSEDITEQSWSSSATSAASLHIWLFSQNLGEQGDQVLGGLVWLILRMIIASLDSKSLNAFTLQIEVVIIVLQESPLSHNMVWNERHHAATCRGKRISHAVHCLCCCGEYKERCAE